MKILHVQSLHLHDPWLRTVASWAPSVDPITIAGDCMPIASSRKRVDDERELRRWLADLRVDVYYSRGPYDVDARKMLGWGLPNLHLSGTHEGRGTGYSIHVVDTYSTEIWEPHATTLPGIVVSHFPPMGCGCATSTPDGENCGRSDVRAMLDQLGDVRLALGGRVSQPRERIGWAEGACVVVPGISYQEHAAEPAFARIDMSRRSIQVYDGKQLRAHSFAR